METLVPILQKADIPAANFIICDNGSTIVYGNTFEAVELLQSNIEKKRPGTLKIQLFVQDIPNITYRHIPQQRRYAFYAEGGKEVGMVRREVQELGCEVIFLGDHFFDVVPKDVNKVSTLRNLVNHLSLVEKTVLIIGETFDDYELFGADFYGVILDNADEPLTKATKNMARVYHAKQTGVDGLSEAIKYFSIR